MGWHFKVLSIFHSLAFVTYFYDIWLHLIFVIKLSCYQFFIISVFTLCLGECSTGHETLALTCFQGLPRRVGSAHGQSDGQSVPWWGSHHSSITTSRTALCPFSSSTPVTLGGGGQGKGGLLLLTPVLLSRTHSASFLGIHLESSPHFPSLLQCQLGILWALWLQPSLWSICSFFQGRLTITGPRKIFPYFQYDYQLKHLSNYFYGFGVSKAFVSGKWASWSGSVHCFG